jgi:glycosyltransferase involved in cell wall biosynthesis
MSYGLWPVQAVIRIVSNIKLVYCVFCLRLNIMNNENKAINEALPKEVLIVHDDLNVCGGSERLAATTIETLAEIGFNVDLATFTMPDLAKIQRLFGIDLCGIRKILLTNLYAVLNVKGELLDVNTASYDIVMNTHGDLLPFYDKHNDNDAMADKKSKIDLTYCHYPLLPYQIRNGLYRTFLEKCIHGISSVDKLFANASSQYNLMMNNNTILTNSTFSAKAIRQLYYNVHPIVLSPPVDIDKFRKANLSYRYSYDKKQNMVLVISRFSEDKEIENAITLANLLKDKCLREKIQEIKMIIVGNFSELNYKYVRFLEKMILDYGLQNYVKLVFGASFDRLLELMKRSKVYFHPLAGEPFGIAIVEAMASGLIPIVPTIGGSSEFVPSEYQYDTIQQAADIIANILNEINYHNALVRSDKISNLVSKFSTQSYKKNLNNIIDYMIKTSKVEEAVILHKRQTRSETTR